MPYALNGNAHIYYEVDGEGPPLILMHGSPSDIQDWRDFGWVTALREDYRLILIDGRGHGESDKSHDAKDYQFDVLAADVLAVLDRLDIKQAHFFGYSWGTSIGSYLAKQAPHRLWSLVLGGLMDPNGEPEWEEHAKKSFGGGMAAHFESYIFPPGRIFTPESKARHLALDPQAMMATAVSYNLEEILTNLKVPCLVYMGEEDYSQETREFVQKMPGAKFVSLPGLGHGQGFRYSHHALPVVQQFLQEVTPPAEQNRALVQRVIVGFNSANYERFDQLYDPNWSCSGHENQRGANGVRHLIAQIFSSFADANAEIEEIVADAEKVTTRWIFKGTHTGEWQGIAPTGRRVRVSGILVDRIANGKIIESHLRYEPVELKRQLAAAPEKDI